MLVAPGSTSISVDVQFLDDSGFAVTGKVAADFPACKWSNGDNTADTTITLSDLAAITTAHPNNNTAGGVKEREGGWYRLDLPNNMFTGSGRKNLTFAETTGKRIVVPEIDCQYTQTNVAQINAVATTSVTSVGANVGTAQPINFDGTGGTAYVKSSLTAILGTLLTETAGQLAAGFKKFFNIASPTSTMNEITLVDTVTNLTNAGPDTAGTTTLLSRLTAARAGYLDNLNVGGNVASHADILAINQSASKHVLLVTVAQYEAGETYTVEARTFAAADGSPVNADSTPTLTATGQVSGSLNANLSAATNPASGVYRWTYTPGATPTLEQIRFDLSATINSSTFTLSTYAQTIDEATAVFTATDQSHLTSIFNKLPTNNIADETLLLAAIGTPAQAATALSNAQWTNALATALTTLAGHDPGGILASHTDIVALGSPMQAGNVTVGGYAGGQDPATLVLAATPSNTPGAGTVALLLRLLDADWSIDTTTVPWDAVATVKGTGLPASMGGTGTEILRKRVRDTGSANITNTTTVVGQEIQ